MSQATERATQPQGQKGFFRSQSATVSNKPRSLRLRDPDSRGVCGCSPLHHSPVMRGNNPPTWPEHTLVSTQSTNRKCLPPFCLFAGEKLKRQTKMWRKKLKTDLVTFDRPCGQLVAISFGGSIYRSRCNLDMQQAPDGVTFGGRRSPKCQPQVAHKSLSLALGGGLCICPLKLGEIGRTSPLLPRYHRPISQHDSLRDDDYSSSSSIIDITKATCWDVLGSTGLYSSVINHITRAVNPSVNNSMKVYKKLFLVYINYIIIASCRYLIGF